MMTEFLFLGPFKLVNCSRDFKANLFLYSKANPGVERFMPVFSFNVGKQHDNHQDQHVLPPDQKLRAARTLSKTRVA